MDHPVLHISNSNPNGTSRLTADEKDNSISDFGDITSSTRTTAVSYTFTKSSAELPEVSLISSMKQQEETVNDLPTTDVYIPEKDSSNCYFLTEKFFF